MPFQLKFTQEADENLRALETDKGREKKLKAVRKALGFLELNPRHQGLNTHKYSSLKGPKGEEVFEAYAENNWVTYGEYLYAYQPTDPLGPNSDIEKVIDESIRLDREARHRAVEGT